MSDSFGTVCIKGLRHSLYTVRPSLRLFSWPSFQVLLEISAFFFLFLPFYLIFLFPNFRVNLYTYNLSWNAFRTLWKIQDGTFYANSEQLKAVSYFCKGFRARSLTGFWTFFLQKQKWYGNETWIREETSFAQFSFVFFVQLIK